MENASKFFTARQVKNLINRQKKKYGWEFLFVAEDPDFEQSAAEIGIDKDRAVQYCAGTDTPAMFDEMSKTLLSFRRTGRVRKNWAENISHDTDKKPKK